MGGRSSFAASNSLRPEQKRAIEFVLHSTDRAVNISGAAGTGKTATLQELRRGLVEAGHNVIAVAPTMSAVEELQRVGFTDALTLERLLQDSKCHGSIGAAVIILDEAGMASGRQMSEFLAVAEKQNARIVFSGDTKQIRSVEAGDALRILEKESRLKTVSLSEVQRQTKKDYRDAMEELRKNPERGFAKLDAIGAVREVPVLERPRAVARAYGSAGNSCIVVCATHNEIETVTAAIREERKQRGELAGKSILMRNVPLNLTAAQKADLRHYQPGQLLAFHRPVKGIAKNETVAVIRLETSGIAVRTASGEERLIAAKQAKSFDVVEARPIEILAGDRLLLMANRREPDLRFTNGEIVTVSSVDSQGRVKLEDGRTIPANYRNFAHGYAITAHRSQGKSVDSVIISADGMEKELFYVAASRGRQNVTVITSDEDGLKESLARSMARKSASELVGRKRHEQAPVACRGLAAARSLVRKAAEFFQAIPKKLIQQQYGRPAKERKREYGLGR